MAQLIDLRAGLDDRRFARLAAMFASVGAAVVHLAVLPTHLREWWLAGVFFGAIAAFQLGWPILVALRPTRGLLVLGLLANTSSIALWTVSRTVGVPAGPHAGIAEPITRVGVLTVVLEVIVCVTALWWLSRGSARSFRSAPAYLSSVGAAFLVVAALTTGALTGVAGEYAHSAEHVPNSSGDGQHRETGHGGGGRDGPPAPSPPDPAGNRESAGHAEPGTGGGQPHQHEHGSP